MTTNTTTNTTTINVINGNVTVSFSDPTISAFSATYKNGVFVYDTYSPLTATNIAYEWARIDISHLRDKKGAWKAAGDKLGCSCAALSKQLRGAMHKVWIKPVEKEAFGMAAMRGGDGKIIWDRSILKDLREALPDMAAYPNNMRVFALLKSRPRLEAEIGPERWDTLVKNSFYRNCCICKRMLAWVERTPKQFYLYGRVESWDFILGTPSTVLGDDTRISNNFFCDCVVKYITEGVNTFKTYREKHPKVPMKHWQDYILANDTGLYEEKRWTDVPF